MPQLDMATWFLTMFSTTITLFILMQLKIMLFKFPQTPTPKLGKIKNTRCPWEMKWTKIYSPLSLPRH
uniref:ATP synthase complex subunit 8 n=1 Tax=Bramus fuscocapillus TaxID=3370997 RepID=A0A873A1B7_9RODE|nr:ATP synthase F0 subunit 8 [Ellobius fuscocapillus]